MFFFLFSATVLSRWMYGTKSHTFDLAWWQPSCIYWKRGEETEASRKWEEEVVLSLASRLHCRWDSPVVSVSMAQLTREADAHSLSHTMHFTHSPVHFGNVYIVCARLAETSYVGAEIVWNNIARIKQAIGRPMSCVILAFKWKAKLTTGFIMVFFDRLQ